MLLVCRKCTCKCLVPALLGLCRAMSRFGKPQVNMVPTVPTYLTVPYLVYRYFIFNIHISVFVCLFDRCTLIYSLDVGNPHILMGFHIRGKDLENLNSEIFVFSRQVCGAVQFWRGSGAVYFYQGSGSYRTVPTSYIILHTITWVMGNHKTSKQTKHVFCWLKDVPKKKLDRNFVVK